MSKYKFSDSQRYAVYTVHGEKCYLCNCPIDLKSMHVDHVLPESLLGYKARLESVINEFGLDKDFEINSYHNWMPSYGPCNLKKLEEVFEPAPIVKIILQRAAKKAAKALELEEKTVSKNAIGRALNTLKRSKEKGELTIEVITELKPLVEFHKNERLDELKDEPIRLSPIYEVISDKNGILTIKGPYGVGGRPSGDNVDGSFNCPNCGSMAAWHGARCVICGMMSDD